MAVWIVCALCALVIIKPQEFISPLEGLPLLYALFAIALLLIVADVASRSVRPAFAPQTPFVVGFLAIAVAVTGIRRPDLVQKTLLDFTVVFGIYLAIWLGVASKPGLRGFGTMFFACAVLVTAVAILQHEGPMGCFLAEPGDWGARGEIKYDGRACENVLDCYKSPPVPEGNYACERVGPLGTSSVAGRVRYRGSLADPNELSLMLAIAVPLGLALVENRRRRAFVPGERPSRPSFPPPALLTDGFLDKLGRAARNMPLGLVISLMGYVVVLSKSRSGLICFLAVVGLYLIRKVGVWGIVAGCIVAPPMLIFGGRSGSEADESANERAELLREGFEFIRNTKGIGIGARQFSSESSLALTAHNSYLLAAAEAGIVGYIFFGFAYYLSLKVPLAIWLGRYRVGLTVRCFAAALSTSLLGATIGIFFLSWSYKDILYMIFGASAALYGVARSDDPTVRVGLSIKESIVVICALFLILVAINVVGRLHK